MKLKYRIEARDAMIFAIFSFCWLIVVSLLVANVYNFIHEEPFTFNILIAFRLSNILVTLLFFIAGIVAIFLGVKSFIFEKEDDSKGVGISIGAKKEKNYSRWSKDEEMKKDNGVARVDPLAPKADAGGIPLIMNEKEVWVDNGEYHNLE